MASYALPGIHVGLQTNTRQHKLPYQAVCVGDTLFINGVIKTPVPPGNYEIEPYFLPGNENLPNYEYTKVCVDPTVGAYFLNGTPRDVDAVPSRASLKILKRL